MSGSSCSRRAWLLSLRSARTPSCVLWPLPRVAGLAARARARGVGRPAGAYRPVGPAAAAAARVDGCFGIARRDFGALSQWHAAARPTAGDLHGQPAARGLDSEVLAVALEEEPLAESPCHGASCSGAPGLVDPPATSSVRLKSPHAVNRVAEEVVPFLGCEVAVFLAGPLGSAAGDEGSMVCDHVLGVDHGATHRVSTVE